MAKVAFQGERGAFSEDAVITFFSDAESVPYRSLGEVFEAVLGGDVDFGVVPVENSQAGSINETYDLLLEYPLNIVGEIDLRVHHYLMTLPGSKLSEIKTVYSHPQALAQCDEFLKKLNVEVIPAYNTAGAARKIKDNGLAGYAAVANRRASEIYELEILAEKIETNPNNYTKFFVIAREKAKHTSNSKTSLVFGVKNQPGALYASLGAFASRGINLTKLESRPSRAKPWEYVFYVDFEGYIGDEACAEAVAELEKHASFVKMLGSYPRASD
ncbi:MAG: prephenate dehydratase [Chloroflexi bacterium]|nr:prephenate dehydratase [Chloroflexota bacterium]